MDRHAKGRLRVLLHSGEQGNRDIPAFPAQWLERLMARSPRGALHYCPRHLADHDTPARSGRSCHRKAWRQNPGRQDHTILPYADHTGRVRETFRSRLPALRNLSRRCHRRPPPPGPRS